MTTINDVISSMNLRAPENIACSWDNVGLQAGDNKSQCKSIMLSLDPSASVIKQAIEKKVSLLITHHPLRIKPLSSIATTTQVGESLHSLVRNNIALYAMHTNLDSSLGGLNDYLAELLELNDISVLSKTPVKTMRLVVFVPQSHLSVVRNACFDAGAGSIGNYDECSFTSTGEGTFRALDGSNPYVGIENRREYIEEVRLEMVVEESYITDVKTAIHKTHPYEMPSYSFNSVLGVHSYNSTGLGRVGNLAKAVSINELVEKLKKLLKLSSVNVIGKGNIKRVALCTGSGADDELIKLAQAEKADVYITGDMKYHNACDARDLGISVIDATHFGTERIVVNLLKSWLKADYQKMKVHIAREVAPWRTV